jgi:hypothetical protein
MTAIAGNVQFMETFFPERDRTSNFLVTGYSMANILEQCGDDLSRTNVMKQAGQCEPVFRGRGRKLRQQPASI